MESILLDASHPYLSPQASKDHSKHRRALTRRAAKKIGRKRLLQDREPTVAHRNSHENGYSGVTFLNSHDVVLATDQWGRIDIVRLSSENHPAKLLLSKLQVPPFADSKLTLLKLYSLSGGEAFCIGLPSGDFCVMATERLDVCTMRNIGTGAVNPQNDHMVPKHHYQSQSFALQQLERFRGPRRRFHRSFRHFLVDQLDKYHFGHFSAALSEVIDWDMPTPHRRSNGYEWLEQVDWLPGRYPSCQEDARWDFRELSPSTVLAAFVDPERDCISIRDTRQRRPSVLISNEHDSYRCQEDITSVCFVSDNALATSHVWRSSGEDVPHHCINLWDLRRTYPKQVQHILPSFPRETIQKDKPEARVWYDDTTKNRSLSRLMSSKTNNTIVASWQGGRQHFLLDVDTQRILYRHNSQSPSGCSDSLLYAVSPCHDLLTTCHPGSSSICVYPMDTQKEPKGRKRDKPEDDEDQEVLAHFRPRLTDRHGIRTRLTCLAFNEMGNVLVGGSLDGDLFSWGT